jgi:cell division protein ZapA (FtsZ GTPase activity inhibitor)
LSGYVYFFSNIQIDIYIKKPFHIIEQTAIAGRASIEKSKLEQIAKIESNRKAALASLTIKYASADKVKTSFGYIGITFLSSIWGLIILNDLAKLLNECYKETKDLLKERRQRKEKERKEQVVMELSEENEIYSQDLEKKLEKFHLQLVKACATRKIKENI